MSQRWYVLRVQSGREESVRRALIKRIASRSMEDVISEVMVPIEKVSEMKGGDKKVLERKKYPGYLMVEMETEPDGRIREDVWYLIKDTTGIGDFVGSHSKPMPMTQQEVDRMLKEAESVEEAPQLKISFNKGDGVKIREGTFQNFNGVVDDVLPDKGIVKVTVTIFGRATPVEIEYWKLEAI
ncbi:MAG: transcription termination/antitermination protein NusG [Planctomycetota bacterium]|nr:transcription termination/antitermination protein NusG [Planctomycetota bacterium]